MMNRNLSHETVCHTYHALKKVRFIQFGQKAFHHLDKDVTRVREAWTRFESNPVSFLATSPESLSRDILTLCQ
jgi:site-specific recombinase XerD